MSVLLDNDGELLERFDNDGNTALLVAAEAGKIETVRMLVDQGADLEKKNYERKTIFDLAMHSPDTNLLRYLMEVARAVL